MEKFKNIDDLIAYINNRLDEFTGAMHYIHHEGQAYTIFRRVREHMYVSYSISTTLVEQMKESIHIREDVIERIIIELNAGSLDLLRMCKQG